MFIKEETEEIENEIRSLNLELVDRSDIANMEEKHIKLICEQEGEVDHVEGGMRDKLTEESFLAIGLRNHGEKVNRETLLHISPIFTTDDERIIFSIFPNFGEQKEEQQDKDERDTSDIVLDQN